MAQNPQFVSSPIIGLLKLTAANTARDGTGTLEPLLTGSTNGTRVDRVTFISSQSAATANSAMVGRIFISDTGGTNFKLYQEVALAAVTASNTAIGQRQQMNFLGGLILKSGMVLSCSKSINAGGQDWFDVIAEGGHF